VNAPWLYCSELRPGRVTLDAAEARHATGSLRLRSGDPVIIFDGQGRIAQAAITDCGPGAGRSARGPRRRARSGEIAAQVAEIQLIPETDHRLTLIVAAPKRSRLDWMIEKCTELGVWRIVLATFRYSVVFPSQSHIRKLHRTAIEACKQCRRAWLPRIEAGLPVEEAVRAGPLDALLVAHPDSSALPLSQWMARCCEPIARASAVIGPEGGLSAQELAALRAVGGQLVQLGPHVLRTETAAVAVAALWTGLT